MNHCTRFWAACGLLIAATSAIWAAQPSENLLPKTTVGFLAVTNMDRFDEHWRKTQMGQLFDDPVMDQFRKDNRKRMQEHWAATRERYGLTLEDLRTVSGGEVAIAMIEPNPGEAATAVVADTTGHSQQAKAVVAKATATMLQQGAKQSSCDVEGVHVAIFEFPPSKENQLPQDASGQSSAPAAAAAAPDRTVYAVTGNLLIASDNVAVTSGILGRLAHGPKGSLAEVPGFAMVMKRCAADAGSPAKHQVRWFVYPLGYAEAARAATPPEKRRRGKTLLEVIRNQGFGAIQGVGGFVDLAVDNYQVVHRTAIYAPQPYTNSMKMLVLPNGGDFTPEPWAPRHRHLHHVLRRRRQRLRQLRTLVRRVVRRGREGRLEGRSWKGWKRTSTGRTSTSAKN